MVFISSFSYSRWPVPLVGLVLACLGLSCNSGDSSAESEPSGGGSGGKEAGIDPVIIERDVLHQTIRGFGASSAWTAPVLSVEQADAFFSVDDGIGLSLLRIQIKPDGTSTELETVDAAVARGAKVWAAPWSPGADLKTNGSTSNGGRLREEAYGEWASQLADFARFMDERGTPLLGLSAQNEPDYVAAWDTCEFSPEQLATFVGDFLAPALIELDTPVPIIAPESANWGSIERYSTALLDHPSAPQSLLSLATHGYGSFVPREVPRIAESGLELWLTEVSDPQQDVPDSGMGSALRVARMIHADLTLGNVSAWHYWWLLPRGDVEDTNAALADRSFELAKRAYALGHYSKFVRPGFIRVGATDSSASLVFSTAFESPDADRLVVVLSSDRSSEMEQEIRVSGSDLGVAQVWVTDSNRELELEETVNVDGESLVVTIPPNSVVTVVLSLA